jgi:hypothetical protein
MKIDKRSKFKVIIQIVDKMVKLFNLNQKEK